ncbi:winged helix-turn-helix transcriptional regulator [Flexivirga sp. ID2601S]|uniref:Winged helix-turn-helix transcriptional regulator n=1 Tax=Flexivirga aerilata TaxID=1656889 RepID=A0A849AG34_9MICO|nr:winged helix-turn-helix transcriptional regulator [Flexivirga aerilata]
MLPDRLVVDRPAQHKALEHPLRHRILRALPPDGATISQLSRLVNTNKGNISHHLRVLLDAGLVRQGPTRTVRGGTERYYLPAARRLLFPTGEDGAATRAMLQAIADEIPHDDDHLLSNRRLRLTHEQAQHLADHLERLVDELPEAPPGAPSYGVLVGVYQRS